MEKPAPRMSWPWLGPVHPLAAWLFVAAVAVRIPGLSRSLWYDELFTQRRFLDSFVNAFGRQREANNHPLASVLAWAAGRLTGSEDKLVLRAPSVLLGALAILAVAWLAGRSGKRAFSWAAAGAAAVLALAHPTLVAYSQEVRGYAGLLLATPLVIGLTLSLLEERGETTWKRRGSLALAVGLGLFFHLTLGIVVAGLIAYSALAPGARWESRRRTLLTLGSGLALGVALYAPILRILSGFARKWTGLTEESPFDGGAPSLERLAKIGEMLSINDLRLLPGWVSPWVLGALLVLLVSAGAWSSFREKDHLALATASVVLTTAVAWTVARPLFFPRFFLFLLPPLLALAARGAASLARASAIGPRGALLVVAPLVVVSALETRARADWEIQPIEPALAFVRESDLGPPCIVGMGSGLVDPSLDFRRFEDDHERDVAAIDRACAAIDSGTRSTLVIVELFPGKKNLLREHVVRAAAQHRFLWETSWHQPGLVSDVRVHLLRKH